MVRQLKGLPVWIIPNKVQMFDAALSDEFKYVIGHMFVLHEGKLVHVRFTYCDREYDASWTHHGHLEEVQVNKRNCASMCEAKNIISRIEFMEVL